MWPCLFPPFNVALLNKGYGQKWPFGQFLQLDLLQTATKENCKFYQLLLETTFGGLQIKLLPALAPNATASD